jgi:TatD DNase family protein
MSEALGLVDTHAHLDDQSFADDIGEVIARAVKSGVGRIIVPAIDRANWETVARLAAAHAGIDAAYGLHPLFLARHRREHLDELPAWLQTHPCVAVGEIGLDFFVTDLDPDDQRRYFADQLAMAKDARLPVIVHARRAVDEVTLAIRRAGGLRGVVHSFSGSQQQAEKLWELGFMLGIGGPVTYERAARLRGIVAAMPLEWLLLETDAPDQPLATHRGARNEPACTAEVLAVIASLREEPAEEIARVTTANAYRLFHPT